VPIGDAPADLVVLRHFVGRQDDVVHLTSARANADIRHGACYLTSDRMKLPTAIRCAARAAPAVGVAHL
jgi:hypothetical protein